jgi:uncharacterized protein
MVYDTPAYLRLVYVLLKAGVRTSLRHNLSVALIPLRRAYLSLTLNREARIRAMTHHYDYVGRNLTEGFLDLVVREPAALWQETRNGTSYRIVLSVPQSLKERIEGDLSLVFQADSTPIFTLTFAICPGNLFGVDDHDVMYIGRLQGRRGMMDLIRASTKNCNDMAQQTLLLAAAEGICLPLNIRGMVCASSISQVSTGRQDGLGNAPSIYDEFWMETGATRIGQGLFYLPVPIPHKPKELIKRCHRSRAAYRRKYRASTSDRTAAAFRALFLDR